MLDEIVCRAKKQPIIFDSYLGVTKSKKIS